MLSLFNIITRNQFIMKFHATCVFSQKTSSDSFSFLIPNKLHSELHQLATWVENDLETPAQRVTLQPFISRYLTRKSNFHDMRSRRSPAPFAGRSVQEQDVFRVPRAALLCRVGASLSNPVPCSKSDPLLQVLDVSEILHGNGRLAWYEPPIL